MTQTQIHFHNLIQKDKIKSLCAIAITTETKLNALGYSIVNWYTYQNKNKEIKFNVELKHIVSGQIVCLEGV
jgi:hypothetical protein